MHIFYYIIISMHNGYYNILQILCKPIIVNRNLQMYLYVANMIMLCHFNVTMVFTFIYIYIYTYINAKT